MDATETATTEEDSHFETPHCPGCRKAENRVVVCSHCGHRYAPGKDRIFSRLETFLWLVLAPLGVWAFVTVLYWIAFEKPSLLEVVISQYEYVKSLRVW